MTAAQNFPVDQPLSEPTEALSKGSLLLGDQFTILRKLGNGGFGITYLANDNYLNRNVVIKECFPEIFCRRTGTSVQVRSGTNMEKFRSIVTMFTREARSIAKLRHPNIIGVHRVFEDNDTAYMALDLIDGQTLLEIIQDDRRKLSPRQVQDILIKLLDAIQTVHDQDLLHRDISPDNILLDKWGNPVLIDFGAAREEASRKTRALSSVLVVKDGYSPQEFYFTGGSQAANSDLYALAATFYHLISGKPPPNSQVRVADIAAGNPDSCKPLSGRFHDYDAVFLKAIDKALSVLPKERLQSATEWRELIDDGNTHSRKHVALPPIDQTLEKTLSRLVLETNEHLRKSQEPPEQPSESPNKGSHLSPPAWVHDFNAETMQRAHALQGMFSRLGHDYRQDIHEPAIAGRSTFRSVLRLTRYFTAALILALITYTAILTVYTT